MENPSDAHVECAQSSPCVECGLELSRGLNDCQFISPNDKIDIMMLTSFLIQGQLEGSLSSRYYGQREIVPER
jgi:hypothetical protein